MSNHASVIFTWSGVGNSRLATSSFLSEEAYRILWTKFLETVLQKLGGHLRVIDWGCGCGGDTPCCENIATASVNHLSPKEIWQFISEGDEFASHETEELQVFYKTEDMETYSEAPK